MKQKKKAFITGVTGQDGSYLAELLLTKNYIVHGMIRKSSVFNTQRLDKIFPNKNFKLHHGDMTDELSIVNLLRSIKPDEVYNLAAQSHVAVSYKNPVYTTDVNALGNLRILEAIRSLNLKNTKFYQASTSELFGKSTSKYQNENTPFEPISPYSCSKLFAYWNTRNYRDAYGIFASNGILFNHESPRRGETFVTRKITKGLCRIKKNLQSYLLLGNLYSKRDWGHSEEYVEAMWKMLQLNKPLDLVISSGKTHTIKDFINETLRYLDMPVKWEGKGLEEKAISKKTLKPIIKISKKYFRPLEVSFLKGNSNLAKKTINWRPKINLRKLVKDMVDKDMEKI
tara:strand:+ start:4562 stop:5584 length:1023 start_codon:yes stop_codon:yes gene_type:complete